MVNRRWDGEFCHWHVCSRFIRGGGGVVAIGNVGAIDDVSVAAGTIVAVGCCCSALLL